MNALSLFGVLVLAKVLILADRTLPYSVWTPLAYLWQDALVALAFGVFEYATRRRPWLCTVVFWVAMAYAAINVPLTRALSSPLTWQMSRAAGGALSDSIAHYLTAGNLAMMGSILIAGFLLPRLTNLAGRRFNAAAVACGLALVILGPLASARVDCAGLHRNAMMALATSMIPRVDAAGGESDWRVRATGLESEEDLSSLHGAAAGRNVVLVALESAGARYLHPYGAKEDPMPNLTKFSGQSLLFENAFSVYPESIKGLFSVLCSRYPAFDIDAKDLDQVRTPSIAQALGQAGYTCGLFHSGRFMYLGMEQVVQNRGFHVLEDAGAIGGNVQSSFGVDEPATVDRMLRWIDSLPRGQRFFLNYLPIAGHHPYDTREPGPFPGETESWQYRNALHEADASLGALIEGLRTRGLETNTLFVFYGDHGEAFGQHEGNYGHTLFLYEENIRVPCLVVAPGLWVEQRRVTRPASLIDLAPTILDLLGLGIPSDYQGSSLLEPTVQMALFYTDYSLPLVGLRDGNWKFIHELDSRRSKLFDLGRDPEETVNLAHAFPDRVQDYRTRLERWISNAKFRISNAEFQTARIWH